ncbi:MAG TPA: DmsC/YnfH family molybdoenzyme membrane anchor subunit [Symbiobacteriaceae bacterium]|nr:DmsC/YnfH family molybdoenzyme membrane anchor subunit [Symbiobacteriaceae bacterium]
MNRENLPLVAFTLLVQGALGAVALAAMAPLRAAGLGDASHLSLTLLGVAAAALLCAMAVSLLHLGVKAGALRSLRNLRTSWLSREVLFTGLFMGLTLPAAALAALGRSSADLLWLAALTGFAAVFTMSRLYQETAHPAWMTPYTPVSFFAASAALGAALGAPLVLQDGALGAAAAGVLLRDILITGAAATAVNLLAGALYAGDLKETRPALAARLLVTTGGMALLALGAPQREAALIFPGALLLGAGELLGRIRFFALGALPEVGEF